MNSKIKEIKSCVKEFNNPKRRVALSKKYPLLKPLIVGVRIFFTKIRNRLFCKIARKRDKYFKHVTARHQSVLRRKLGDTDLRLQEQKITNLKRASDSLDGLVINPGETFSFWEAIGKPSYKNGYVDGMLLASGKIIEGVGGGLCQLSNFLCWIFLHAETKIIQRHHHSMDVFPDSGRILPFGSGATCLYNFVDLQIKNIGNTPIQIKIWLTNKHLKGQIMSPKKRRFKFSIQEKNHCFVKNNDQFFRYNEIFRVRKKEGNVVSEKLLFKNFAPVLYKIPDNYFKKHGFHLLDFSE